MRINFKLIKLSFVLILFLYELQKMKRRIIFSLIETTEISSDSDISVSSDISELNNSLTKNKWKDDFDKLIFCNFMYYFFSTCVRIRFASNFCK